MYLCSFDYKKVLTHVILCVAVLQANLMADSFSLPQQRDERTFDGSAFIPTYQWDPHFNYEEYALGPGDVLNLHMWGAKTLDTKVYISPNFDLFIPLAGPVNVKGKKMSQVRKLVSKKINSVYKNTYASIALFSPRTFLVPVSGNLVSPGEKPATGLMRLNEFLGSNSILVESSGLTQIEISNDLLGESKIVDYQSFLVDGDYEGNPFLRDGDSIVIPRKENVVILKGNVVRGGRFEFPEKEIMLADAVERLGGFKSEPVRDGQVSITRLKNGKSVTVAYSQSSFFDKTSPVNFYSFKIIDGDQIFFPTGSIMNPTINAEVFITGEVKNPGNLSYQAGMPATTYLSAVGGLTVRGNYSKAVVYKANGQTIKLSTKPMIEPGDTIYVPEKTFKFWNDHLYILTTLLTVVTTTLAITR